MQTLENLLKIMSKNTLRAILKKRSKSDVEFGKQVPELHEGRYMGKVCKMGTQADGPSCGTSWKSKVAYKNPIEDTCSPLFFNLPSKLKLVISSTVIESWLNTFQRNVENSCKVVLSASICTLVISVFQTRSKYLALMLGSGR